MLQDYTATQNNFRRYMPPAQAVVEAATQPGHSPAAINPIIGRPVDQAQYQFLANKMHNQIESFNALRELGKKFLETSSSTNPNSNPSTK